MNEKTCFSIIEDIMHKHEQLIMKEIGAAIPADIEIVFNNKLIRKRCDNFNQVQKK